MTLPPKALARLHRAQDMEEVRRILARYPIRKSPKAAEGKKKRREEKTQKAAARRLSTAAVRAAVMDRAAYRCEFCGGPGVLQMHHLEGGSGRRREKQWVGNCVGICGFCHREYHRDAETAREAVMEWCVRWQYPVPARFRRSA